MIEPVGQIAQVVALFPAWLRLLLRYLLALLFVAAAVLAREVMGDVLSPTPFLVFYLAWVAAAAFGGLGPGLLATIASWLCVNFFFDPAFGHIGFGDPTSVGRFVVFLAGGLVVSFMGEKIRRARIRERRRARELAAANVALRASERKYRFLVENSKDITWMTDLQGRWTFISGNVEQVSGYRADELMSKTIWDLLAPECHDLVKEKLRRRIRGEDLLPYEVLVVGKDGRRIPFEVHTASIVDAAGNIVGVQGVSRDITERKKAEAALRDSEAGLAAAQRLAHIGSWQWNIAEDTARWSDETFRIFGIVRGPLQEHRADFVSRIVPEDRQRVDQALSDALRGVRDYDLDYRIRRPDGQERVIHAQAQVLRAEDGRPVMMHGTVQDITERQQAEEALRESEEKYRRIVETATEAIVMADAEARIVFVNERWSELVGYSREEAGQMTIFDLVFPEDLAVTKQRWESRKQGRKERYEFRLRRKDGSAVWALISMTSRFGPAGEFLGELVMAVDITQRKRAEEALRRSEARLNRSQEIAHLGSWELDLATNQLSWSDEVYRIFGLAPQEFGATYEAFLERVHPDDRQAVDEAYRGSIREGRDAYEIEHRIIRKDTGEVRTVHEKCEHFRDARGKIVRSFGMVHDITDRQQAEEALRASEERFRRMAESIDEIFFIVTPDWRRPLYVSPGYERIFGLKGEDLDRDTLVWLDIVVPEDRPVVRDLIERQARGEIASRVTVEFRIMPRDESVRWIQANTYPILDDRGAIQLITGAVKDITERKLAEEELAESRKKYRGLVEKINDWVWEVDVDCRYSYSSPRALELLGYAPEEIVGKTPFDLMPPDEAQRVCAVFGPIWRERKPFELLENTLVRKDGRLVTVETSGMPLFAEDGSFRGYTGVDRDVTSRKQAEEALRKSEEKYRALVENSLVGIGISKGNQIVYANRSLLRMFGYEDFEEFAARPLLDHLTPASRVPVEQWGQRAGRGEELPAVLEHDIVRKDGTIRTLQLSVSFLSGEDGVYAHTAFIDITERKQAEEALREWNATLESRVAERTEELERRARQLQKLTLELSEAEERERERVAAVLHDDLQQVLAAAKFQVGLLSSGTHGSAQAQEILGRVKEMLKNAIEKSRHLSHELSPAVLRQGDLVEAFDWLAGQMQVKHGLTVRVEALGTVEARSEAVKTLVYRSAQEMLFNVVKHAEVGEARLRVRRRGRYICLSVSDRGRGFDPREIQKTARLGLLSIRERVALLGGRMKARSARGKGTTFRIIVPDTEPSPNDAAPERESNSLPKMQNTPE